MWYSGQAGLVKVPLDTVHCGRRRNRERRVRRDRSAHAERIEKLLVVVLVVHAHDLTHRTHVGDASRGFGRAFHRSPFVMEHD